MKIKVRRGQGRGYMTEEEAPEALVVMPCPFCGVIPEQMGSGEGQRGLMIHCISDGCVNPHVSYYDHASAIRAWNRRAPIKTA